MAEHKPSKTPLLLFSQQQTNSVTKKQSTTTSRSNQTRYRTSAFLQENANPFPISGLKKWDDLVEEEEEKEQMAQSMSTS